MRKPVTKIISLSFTIFFFSAITCEAQLKVHDDGDVSIGTLSNDWDWALKVQSNPNNGPTLKLESDAGAYELVSEILVDHDNAKSITVTNGTSGTFVVYGDGYVVCKDVAETSDERLKENVTDLSGSLERILRLRGVNYSRNGVLGNPNPRIELGFIAQEVMEVVPEVVQAKESEVGNDIQAISYSRIVALLTEGIKEQQAIINELGTRIQEVEALLAIPKSLDGSDSGDSKLMQNVPNPGLGYTTIPVFVDENASEAVVILYNLEGRQVLKKYISGTGSQEVVVQTTELAAGRYLYSLYVNGMLSGTKSMILMD